VCEPFCQYFFLFWTLCLFFLPFYASH
jgi:hypothetical protein